MSEALAQAEDQLPVPLLQRLRSRLPRWWPWAAAAVTFGLALAAAAMLLSSASRPQEVTIDLGGPLVFHTLPDFNADLKPSGGRTRHLRLTVVVQIAQDHLPRLEEQQVATAAAIQARLRDLEYRDLAGKAGTERLRDELIALINHKIAPAHVRTVLFPQFLID